MYQKFKMKKPLQNLLHIQTILVSMETTEFKIMMFLLTITNIILGVITNVLLMFRNYIRSSVLARISKGQGATSEKGTFKRKLWLKKGTLFLDCFYN